MKYLVALVRVGICGESVVSYISDSDILSTAVGSINTRVFNTKDEAMEESKRHASSAVVPISVVPRYIITRTVGGYTDALSMAPYNGGPKWVTYDVRIARKFIKKTLADSFCAELENKLGVKVQKVFIYEQGVSTL